MSNETWKQRRARGRPRKADIDIRPVSGEEAFLAAHDGRERYQTGPIPGEGGGMTDSRGPDGRMGGVTHRSADLCRMYKPTPQGYMPRIVLVTAIKMNYTNGWLDHCPDCGSKECGGGNDCPNREPMQVRICPVCGKRIEDNYSRFEVDDGQDDPNVIHDGAYSLSTPATRTKAQLDRHLWWKHPTEAQGMGLQQPAEMGTSPMEAAATARPQA